MLDQRLEPYFPMPFRWLGYILILVSLLSLLQSFLWPPFTLVLGIFLSTARYGIKIDYQQRKYKEYLLVLGFKPGSWKSLPDLERITIHKSSYSQVLGSRGSVSEFKSTLYRGFLRGPADFKIPLSVHKDSQKVLAVARKVAEQFQLRILDCTIRNPAWIT